MMGDFAEKSIEKTVEKTPTVIERFWDDLEKTVPVEPTEKEKQEAKIADFWNSFVEKNPMESNEQDSSENSSEDMECVRQVKMLAKGPQKG